MESRKAFRLDEQYSQSKHHTGSQSNGKRTLGNKPRYQLSASMSRKRTLELSKSPCLSRFSICRYFSRDKETTAERSRPAESIKESIIAGRAARGQQGKKGEERDPGEMPLAPRNLSRFFSSPSYYNTALLYLRDDSANVRAQGQAGVGGSRHRLPPLEIASFSRTLLVAHRWDTVTGERALILTASFR